MSSAIIVHPNIEASRPFAADYAYHKWSEQGPTELIRLEPTDPRRVGEIFIHPEKITRLIAWGRPLTEACLDTMPELKELALEDRVYGFSTNAGLIERMKERGVRRYNHPTEGFWRAVRPQSQSRAKRRL